VTYVIAVDPGKMTGWAYTWLMETWDANNVTAGQTPAAEFCDWIADTPAFMMAGNLFIVESFTITASTARKSPQPDALETIGVLKFLARRSGARLEEQMPSAAKRFVSDTQLRNLNLWYPGKDHARDAIRHLVLGIVSHGGGQAREELLQSLA
jgi:hypothetical protein